MKRLGILGTFVWDTVWTLADQAAGRALESWGGMSFSLASAAAARPDGWEIVPIVHVGADLYGRAHEFLDTLPGIGSRDAVVSVDQPNNRVELVYTSESARGEKMSGGVPGWSWDELAPHVGGLDALLVNFFSGWEIDLPTARSLASFRRGGRPVYADLHSLFLGPPRSDGPREPRRLPDAAAWLRCFDAVQMNEEEFDLLALPSPSRFAPPRAGMPRSDAERFHAPLRTVFDAGPEAVLITRGARGAMYMGDEFFADRGDPARAVLSGEASAVPRPDGGDPTGCGDVWGAAAFCGMLAGLPLGRAVQRANAIAATRMRHRGATGLYEHLAACRAEWE
jgi:hypothetical protein